MKKRRIRYKIYGFFLLAMGIFLLVPGLTEPRELFAPLLAGLFSTAAGIAALWCGGNRQSKQFIRAAQTLLGHLKKIPSTQVRFTHEGMDIAGTQTVPYTRFDLALETEDLFLLTYEDQILVLQKRDLATGNGAAFFPF